MSNSNNTAPLLERAFLFLEDGEWEGDELLALYCTYDEQGNMIEFGDRMIYVLVGGPFNTTEYTYDENGDCVRKIDNNEYFRYRGIDVDPLTTKYSYTYEDGKKTEKYEKTEDGKHLVETYHYNDDKLSKIVYYDSDGEELPYGKTFDEYGRLTTLTEPYRQEKYSYDNDGRLEKIKHYIDTSGDESGEYVLMATIELHYDFKGNLTEAEIEYHDGDCEDISFETDEYGNIIEGERGLAVKYEYKKIRVSREQALKLIGENASLLYNFYVRDQEPLYYRIEE